MRRAGEGRSLTERQTGRQETGGAPGQEPRGQGGKGQASPPSALGLPNDCPSPGLPPTEWEFTGTGGGPGAIRRLQRPGCAPSILGRRQGLWTRTFPEELGSGRGGSLGRL